MKTCPRSHSVADSASASTSTRLGPALQKRAAMPCRRRIEQRQAGGQQRDGEGQQHSEDLGLDEEGLADPEQAGQEIAEPEPPADLGGGDGAVAAQPGDQPRSPATRWLRG